MSDGDAGAINGFFDEYRFLSNFYVNPEGPVVVDESGGLYAGEWLTGEHLFQAMKTSSEPWIERIRAARSPRDAKKLGRQVSLRGDWEEIKIPCMMQVLACKFRTGSEVARLLLETGDRALIEGNTWGDTFWGVSFGSGTNHLGRLLEHRREMLRTVEAMRP